MHDPFRIAQNIEFVERSLELLPICGTWGLKRKLVAEGCDAKWAEKLVRVLDPEGPGT